MLVSMWQLQPDHWSPNYAGSSNKSAQRQLAAAFAFLELVFSNTGMKRIPVVSDHLCLIKMHWQSEKKNPSSHNFAHFYLQEPRCPQEATNSHFLTFIQTLPCLLVTSTGHHRALRWNFRVTRENSFTNISWIVLKFFCYLFICLSVVYLDTTPSNDQDHSWICLRWLPAVFPCSYEISPLSYLYDLPVLFFALIFYCIVMPQLTKQLTFNKN